MTLAFEHKTALLVSSCSSKKVAKSSLAHYFYSARLSMAAVSTAVLMSSCANAQSTNSPAPAVEGASGAASPTPATPATPVLPRTELDHQPAPQDAAKPDPKYNSKDIERAFTFMDTDRDGKISRQEASGFRNVAKHFDAADTNKDNYLSLEEFGNALNRP